METAQKVLQTARGELTISGSLRDYEDLSIELIQNPQIKTYEEGVQLSRFTKPSQTSIKTQFNVTPSQVLNSHFSQDIYTDLFGDNVKKNTNLNRYSDVLVCNLKLDERNAVTLPQFINASWIAGPFHPQQRRQYIAAQGPLPQTVEDFWKMVWVLEVQSIFMLCSPQECEIKKCEFYWPHRQPSLKIGGFSIENLAETRRSGHIVRNLEVTCRGETRRVTHFHYVSWPDHGVPQETETLENLLQDLHSREGENPILIHCSAGVGRTGTLIALSHLKHVVLAQRAAGVDLGISVFSVVRRLREQRVMMVQTKEQYELLFDFVALWLRQGR